MVRMEAVCSQCLLLLLLMLTSARAEEYHIVLIWENNKLPIMQQFIDLHTTNNSCFNGHKFILHWAERNKMEDYNYAGKLVQKLKSKNVLAVAGKTEVGLTSLMRSEWKIGLAQDVGTDGLPFVLHMPPMTLEIASIISAAIMQQTDWLSVHTVLFIDPAWGSANEAYQLLKVFRKDVKTFFFKGAFEEDWIHKVFTDKSKTDTQFVALIKNSHLNTFIKYMNIYDFFSADYRWFFFTTRLYRPEDNQISDLIRSPSLNISFVKVHENPEILNETKLSPNSTSDAIVMDIAKILLRYFESWTCEKTIAEEGINMVGRTGYFELTREGSSRQTWSLNLYRGHKMNFSEYLPMNVRDFNYRVNIRTFRQQTIDDLRKIFKHIPLTRELKIKILRKAGLQLLTVVEYPFITCFNESCKDGIFEKGVPLLDQLDGFTIAVAKQMCQLLQVPCTIHLSDSKIFGISRTTDLKRWQPSMMAELMLRKYDVAVHSLRLVAFRDKIADRLPAIHNGGLNLLLKDPMEDTWSSSILADMFMFVKPVDQWMWIGLLASTVAVGVVLTLLDCVMPNTTRFNLYDSVYINLSNLVFGATSVLPDRVSGRIVTSFFWVFSLIGALFFICNFSAFQISERLDVQISSLSSLLKQKSVNYGTLAESPIRTLFQAAPEQFKQDMYQVMLEERTLWQSTEEATEAVQEKNTSFALIYESWFNEYSLTKTCGLKVTSSFDEGLYGYYAKKDFVFRDLLEETLSGMAKSGWLVEQWEGERTRLRYAQLSAKETNKCHESKTPLESLRKFLLRDALSASIDPRAQTLYHTLGIYVIMVCGGILAVILAILECIFSAIYKCAKAKLAERKAARELKMKKLSKRRFSLETVTLKNIYKKH